MYARRNIYNPKITQNLDSLKSQEEEIERKICEMCTQIEDGNRVTALLLHLKYLL